MHSSGCRIATTTSERNAAFQLVYSAYRRRGLQKPNQHGVRVTQHHLLPTTSVFVEFEQGAAVSTVSLVLDGESGLPMESVYGEEVDERRSQGLRLAEVTCLAHGRSDSATSPFACGEVLRLMVQYAQRQGVHQLLVVAHPKHGRYYQRLMGFQQIGGVSTYPDVCHQPAAAFCFDFDHIDQLSRTCYEFFFGKRVPTSAFNHLPMTVAQQDFFARMVHGNVVRSAPPVGFAVSETGHTMADAG